MHTAYLIVVCDRVDNHILEVTIWSSPEWEQSRCHDQPTYVAYQVGHKVSYHEAVCSLLKITSDPRSRYHWLYQKLSPEQRNYAARSQRRHYS